MLESTVVFFTGQTTAWPLTWAGFREGELKSENRYWGTAWRSRKRPSPLLLEQNALLYGTNNARGSLLLSGGPFGPTPLFLGNV